MSEEMNAEQQKIVDLLQGWWGLGKYSTQLIFGPTSDEGVQTFIYTSDRSYKIVASDGYLGGYMSTRKPRIGETWTRGSDLPDGKLNKHTWDKIIASILSLEIETSLGNKTVEPVGVEEEAEEAKDSEEGNCREPLLKEDTTSPVAVVRKRFDEVTSTINKKFGDGYATKNPDLVKFLMVEISQEIEMRNRPTN